MKNKTANEPCQQCEIRKIAPLNDQRNPKCIYCGAHGIRYLQRLAINNSEKTLRLRAWLSGYIKDGHDEKELRELAKK